MEEERLCGNCDLSKPTRDFGKFKYYCRSCVSKLGKEYRQKNKEHVQKLRKANRQAKIEHFRKQDRVLYNRMKVNNPIKLMLGIKRREAKKRGIAFDLTVEDITLPEFCPVLGIRLAPVGGTASNGCRDSATTLDRFDPKKGYTKENVQVISFRANRIKNDATLEELERIVAWMRSKTS